MYRYRHRLASVGGKGKHAGRSLVRGRVGMVPGATGRVRAKLT